MLTALPLALLKLRLAVLVSIAGVSVTVVGRVAKLLSDLAAPLVMRAVTAPLLPKLSVAGYQLLFCSI
ncbi:hypothetical protein E05_42210 [Plautia stali symbiont]|nr:hypothetical protein E05_42210 [Plautia stali symbiont]